MADARREKFLADKAARLAAGEVTPAEKRYLEKEKEGLNAHLVEKMKEVDKNGNGNGHSLVSAYGIEPDRSSGEKSAGSATGNSSGTRKSKSSSGNDTDAFRSTAKSLGDGGKSTSSYDPTRSGNARNNARSTSNDRQTSGKTPTDFALGLAKRALAYVGFDVSGDADALTETEINSLMPTHIQFVQQVGMAFDYGLTHANAYHSESDIWVFDENEAKTVAHWWLKRSKKVRWMAQVSRQVPHMSSVGETTAVAKIVGERMAASFIFMHANGGFKPWINS